MTLTIKNPVRCAALLVVFVLAVARGELTLAQDLAPDPYFSPIADKSTPLMPRVILRNIREDRDGNIWFASFGGPIRYNGKAFTNFAQEAGIAERRIFSLIVDKSGALWFGSITGGASKYDGKSFTRFTTKEGLSGNDVFWIFEDEEGNIWLATDGGVSRYDGKTFTNYSTKDGLPHNSVYAIAQDRSGKLWFGTQGGIASHDGKTFTNFAGIAGREFTNIRSIVEDKAGNLWFGGQFGVYRYDGKTGTMLTAKDGLLDDFVGSMIVDKAGSVWFGHPRDERGGTRAMMARDSRISLRRKGCLRRMSIACSKIATGASGSAAWATGRRDMTASRLRIFRLPRSRSDAPGHSSDATDHSTRRSPRHPQGRSLRRGSFGGTRRRESCGQKTFGRRWL